MPDRERLERLDDKERLVLEAMRERGIQVTLKGICRAAHGVRTLKTHHWASPIIKRLHDKGQVFKTGNGWILTPKGLGRLMGRS